VDTCPPIFPPSICAHRQKPDPRRGTTLDPTETRAATCPRKLSTPQRNGRTSGNPGCDTPAETVNTSENSTNLQKLGLRHFRGNCQHLREIEGPPELRAATLPRKLSTPQRTRRTCRDSGCDTSAETVNTSEKLKDLQKLGLRRSRGNCQHTREPQENPEARAATLPRKLSTPWRISRTSRNSGCDTSAKTVNISEKSNNPQTLGLRRSRGNCQHPPNKLHDHRSNPAHLIPRIHSWPINIARARLWRFFFSMLFLACGQRPLMVILCAGFL